MMHKTNDLATAGRALAELVKRFRKMKPAGECGPEVEHTLSLMDQQSEMILREYEAEDINLGDA